VAAKGMTAPASNDGRWLPPSSYGHGKAAAAASSSIALESEDVW
jgi:hypothetical protein